MAYEAVNIATHFLWLLLSVPATAYLWLRCRDDRPKQWTLSVYGFSLFLCAAGSTAYHVSNGLAIDDPSTPSAVALFAVLDHMGIYLLIAGTTTAIVSNLMHGTPRARVLVAIWLAAGLGILALLFENNHSRWFSVATYLAMGWGLVSTAPGLARSLPPRDLRLIWIGGACYTAGAAAHALAWPTLWPDVLGPHQFLHLFVLAGSAAHFQFLRKYVVPYRRPPAAAPREAAPFAEVGR